MQLHAFNNTSGTAAPPYKRTGGHARKIISRLAVAILAGLVAMLGPTGCGRTPEIYKMRAEDLEGVRSGLGRIGVAVSTYPLKLEINKPAKGMTGGAARGVVVGATAAVVVGVAAPVPGGTVIGVLAAPFTAAAGGVYGATRGAPGGFCGRCIRMILACSLLSACGGVSVVGLHPENPPLVKRAFAIFCDFVEVDSLQPTFRWRAFPGPKDDFADKIRDVTYELRVWTATREASGKLIYARQGLKTSFHKLEEPLEASTRHLRSVRAHFLIDGKPRVTEWGMAGLPLRNESVPNFSCFRFKTPQIRP
ncbi:MAG: hypothetical protein GY859_30025 [Desulfobacterales bacterium]|nr:hypothetical protein [Desulfobacterales bacterium]